MIKLRVGKREFTVDDEYYGIESLGVFGSFTTGDFNEDSDMNFFVVISNNAMERGNINEYTLGNAMGVPGSWISLYTKSKLEDLREKKSFWCWIMKVQLRILYSRSNYIFDYFEGISTDEIDVIAYMKNHNYRINYMMERYNSGVIFIEDLLASILAGIRGGFIALCYVHGTIDVGKYTSATKAMSYRDVKVGFNMKSFKNFYDFVANDENEQGMCMCPRKGEKLAMAWYNSYKDLYVEICKCYIKRKESGFYNILPKIKNFNRLQRDKEPLDCYCLYFNDVKLLDGNGN